ncbi:Hypothetical protein NTJ_04793 [Nesidiocoris tenuis]|uniref:CAP-Gly domain-containing protein n=1 Tax=Nesidiocoris tenuis TaxID=355587 RepID=A0ABN7AI90_9HEMI|nr:Hypothetical protein NTJ_04793 [Nesidiocoris tenuis]
MEDDVPVLSDGEIDGSLETVRVLHRTVVSLRTALEKSKAELHQLREQVKQQQDKDDPSPYERTIESLSIENHVLRGRYASERQILDVGRQLDRRDQQTDIDRQTDIDPQTGKMDGDEEENSRHDVEDESDVDDVFEDDDDVKFNGINAKKESSAKDQQNSRLSKGSEDDSEEVDDIELIFMTDDTKDDLNMAEDLVPIVDDGCGKFVKREGRSVLVETDISKCGVIDENEPPPQAPVPQQQLRRNTAPMLAPLSCKTSDVGSYKPIPHRELVDCGSARVKFNVAEHRSPVRPVLVDRRNLTSADRQESEAQTDITALPVHWRSESFLAQDRAVAMATTLPSKFQVEGSRAHQLRKQSLKHCERTQEARRVLLSDINFTSMVPELSRSADHLCGGAVSAALLPTSAALLSKYPRALAYMKNPDLPCGGWSPCDCSGRQPSWDYGPCGSSASMAVSASSELGLHGDCGGRRRHSMRPSLSSLDASSWASPPHHHQHHQHHQQHKQHHHHQQQSANRPLWASVPSSPTHTNRSRSAVPLSCSAYIHRTTSTAGQNSELVLHPNMRHHRLKYAARHKVKFSDRKLSGSFPGRSLPDLRGGGSVDSGADEDSTDSLIDESEAYLRRSIDSIVGDGADEPVFVKRGRRPRSYSQPDHVFTNGCGPGRKAQPFIARVPSDLKADTWVKVIANDGRLVVGRVRYVGPLPGVNDIQVGVVLAPGEGGNSSGTFAGVKYFDCDADCGLFAPFKKVVMAWSNP